MKSVIGTAGWSIARDHTGRFPSEGSALQRYSTVFGGAEINSSFHRSHRASTWQRWAESVPADFRFSAKLPKTITHVAKLIGCEALLDAFLEEVAPLSGALEVLLVQLPPKLAFDPTIAQAFFAGLCSRTSATIACEPRHPSWFEADAEALLARLKVSRVAADPAVVPAAAVPGGWRGLDYWRLHGSPAMYRSAYGAERLERIAEAIDATLGDGRRVWCMFDNTASSAATGDALWLHDRLNE
jgi:uncharacterized protein YecE (DUF72 family)